MKKIWLLIIPILLCLLSCDMSMPGTGGNPYEGLPCNQNIMKVHAGSLALGMTVNCSYKRECNVKLGFRVTSLQDSLEGMCFGNGSEWRFESFDTSMTVTTKLNSSYPVKLSQDDHLLFSLIDINNVEKKYDIDLSGITRSYTVRGDSIDVNVMNGCRLSLYSCNKDFIYGSRLPDGKYMFAVNDGCKDHYGYDCLWHNQGPSQKDDLEISATIYWKK